MPAEASDDNDAIRTGERDEAVEGVDDTVWDVFNYFGVVKSGVSGLE